MIIVYNYLNYRAYLKAFYDFKKSRDKAFSYGVLAQKANISSRGLLKLIMDGKRNLSHSNTEKLIQGLKLNKSEALYFSTLVQFNQAKNHQEKNLHYQKLLNYRYRQNPVSLQKAQYNFYSKWYFPVVHELVLLENAPSSPETFAQWASQQFHGKVSPREVLDAYNELISLGLLQINMGKLEPQNSYIESNVKEELNFAIQSFHHQMLKEAQDALNQPLELREFGAVTLAFRKSDLAKAKSAIAEFRRQFNFDFSAHQGADCVYQLNVQFFELADGKPLLTDSTKDPNSAIVSPETWNIEQDDSNKTPII